MHSLITPADERAPVKVNRYLLPNEHKVILVRKHPAVLIRPILFLVLGLILAGVLTEFVGVHSGWALLFIWVLFLVDLGYFTYQAVQWWTNYFVVTSHRFLETSGLITRKVNLMPLAKVTDVVFERSFQGRVFGFGKLHLESAGQCGPCLNGLPAIATALAGLARPRPAGSQLDNLRRWSGLVTGRGACHHPDGTMRFVASALRVFAAEIDEHGRGRCTATRRDPFLPLAAGARTESDWR